MHSFEELSADFAARFKQGHFPAHPASLYQPADYFLSMGGKRVRPVLCLMGNELFGADRSGCMANGNRYRAVP